MSNLLIGSSNVYRFHKLLTKKDEKQYKLVCCTNLEVWNNTIDDIKMKKGRVIVSVIENLICDAVAEVTDPEARGIVAEDVIGCFFGTSKELCSISPRDEICSSSTNAHIKHQWYTDSHAKLSKMFCESIKDMKIQNVAKVDGIPGWSQILFVDGVHLKVAM